jgi:hypothetical protein
MKRSEMTREEFDEASADVIAMLADMLGVTEQELLSSHRGDKISPALRHEPADAPARVAAAGEPEAALSPRAASGERAERQREPGEDEE